MPTAQSYRAIAWQGDSLRILDQLRLPAQETYIEAKTSQDVADAIRNMNLRGAPLIGCAAAYGMALGAREGDLEGAAERLKAARPTAVALFYAVNRMLTASRAGKDLDAEAELIAEEDRRQNAQTARLGASLLTDKAPVLTICNTGVLCTMAHGTAYGAVVEGWRIGKVSRVYACETRPYLQGSRLTMWELQRAGVPATLITDGMAGHLMKTQGVQAVFAGADRIAANGDTANKIGTYGLAVLARHHNIPFYIVAPSPTVDFKTADGSGIPIEERSVDEVVNVLGARIAPEGIDAWHPAFDVTPHELISAIITEKGVIQQPNAEKMRRVLR